MTETMGEKKTFRKWREESGLTQQALGELVGRHQNLIFEVESGKVSLNSATGRDCLSALGVEAEQVAPPEDMEVDYALWVDDGFSPDAPKMPLEWWRERRFLNVRQLAYLSETSSSTIHRIEHYSLPVSSVTKLKIARALRVAPTNLIFPGDDIQQSPEGSSDARLRAELRGARRALRLNYDHFLDPTNSTNKGLDRYYANIKDITERELKGT